MKNNSNRNKIDSSTLKKNSTVLGGNKHSTIVNVYDSNNPSINIQRSIDDKKKESLFRKITIGVIIGILGTVISYFITKSFDKTTDKPINAIKKDSSINIKEKDHALIENLQKRMPETKGSGSLDQKEAKTLIAVSGITYDKTNNVPLDSVMITVNGNPTKFTNERGIFFISDSIRVDVPALEIGFYKSGYLDQTKKFVINNLDEKVIINNQKILMVHE